ncbi:MAG TPA: ATPase, T2SS/T4P/T4SS family, partial [Candidatus Woesebacteria bacterium]|nr:ATPase, T2SS/T4P/T4SS family [Candidatus Woesebacteria bacterium]
PLAPTQSIEPAQPAEPEVRTEPEVEAESYGGNNTLGNPDDLGIAEPVFTQPIPTDDLQPIPTDGLQSVLTNGLQPIPTDDLQPIPTIANPPNSVAPAGPAFAMTNSFFDILVQKGIISPQQAEEIRQENLNTGRSYEELVSSKQLATETEIVQAKAEFNNVPYIKLATIGVDPEALTLIDEGIAKRFQALPFSVDKDKKILKIAMINPLDLAAIEFLKQKTGYNISAYYSEATEIARMIDDHYAQSLSSEVTEALKSTTQDREGESGSVELDQQNGGILRDAPINRIVENILDFAIKSRASDVHIEPQINRTRVRYRIDGILAEKLILPLNVHEAVVSRIKIMANLKIDEKRLPQDGRFNYKTNKAEIDLRISTLPTVHGEKVVMRLLQKDMAVPSLEDLGLTGLGLQRVMEAIKIPYGIILITGPTGSGKTTTLYSILNIINKVGVNIMTLEDPVEYQIPGVSQVQTNPKAGLTFASGLRSFLRQDPDIIMVGEIRDNETADLALQASLTGHLVFSTLHTNSAAGALPRLLDMEAEPFLLASSMTLSMGQRVVRRINDQYKEEYKPEPIVIEDIKKVLGVHFDRWCKEKGKKPEEITLFRPSNKRPVTEPEYKGRIGIFEVMPVSPEISSLILNRKPASEIERVAIQQGMTLMKQDGYLKVLDGITTVEEILRVAEVG